jgi:protein disulfide-isomerase
MKTLIRTLAVFAATVAVGFADASAWTTDWEAAKARSKEEKKPILIYFTGSDWCGWCKKLEKEVITKKEFLDFAGQNFVLMEADFPRKKDQSAELKKQNKALDKTYKIEGYPTMYMLDAEGKKLSDDLGELKGGVEGYLTKLKELLAKTKE